MNRKLKVINSELQQCAKSAALFQDKPSKISDDIIKNFEKYLEILTPDFVINANLESKENLLSLFEIEFDKIPKDNIEIPKDKVKVKKPKATKNNINSENAFDSLCALANSEVRV